MMHVAELGHQARNRTDSRTKRTEWRFDERVQEIALALISDNPHASRPALIRAVRDDPTLTEQELPSDKTLARFIDEQRGPPDTSGPWQFGDPSITNQALVLETLAELVTWTEGRVQYMTQHEARNLTELAPHTVDLSIRHRWRLATLYRARRARHAPTVDLDQFLAFKPWLDESRRQRYEQAITSRQVIGAPRMLYEDIYPGMRYGDLEQQSYAQSEVMSYADLEGDIR
jgi:hypothetical protein